MRPPLAQSCWTAQNWCRCQTGRTGARASCTKLCKSLKRSSKLQNIYQITRLCHAVSLPPCASLNIPADVALRSRVSVQRQLPYECWRVQRNICTPSALTFDLFHSAQQTRTVTVSWWNLVWSERLRAEEGLIGSLVFNDACDDWPHEYRDDICVPSYR